MEKRSIRHVDTMSGSGHLLIASAIYRAFYKIEVFQEFIEIEGNELPGLKKMRGYLQVIDDRLPDLFNPKEAILELTDGRKIGINLPPLLEPKRDFEFTLQNAMDLAE
jgi:hypothetical protein